MDDDRFLQTVVDVCRRVTGVSAVALGGSRARGDHRPDSDWDFAVYYRGDIDLAVFDAVPWEGQVYRPFEWGQVMYGGAVFDLEGRHFDIHFRNLDVVEHWWSEAERGRFEVHILGFHLAGIPTYMLVGELATNQVLWGDLPRPTYPDALRRQAPSVWLGRAGRELDYAAHWARTENAVACAGALAKVTLQAAHARLAQRGVWALNEKRMIQWADLAHLNAVFGSMGTTEQDLQHHIEEVRSVVTAIEHEQGG
ncbi:MAG TPA: nucleotidyltransferase domain-containing protein [Acidimicrobiales bacterium]|nr:nucleotidyltransferase domain-containing protein [Acidimicrobiales bacterium]